MRIFLRQFRNARTAVHQIKRGEWVPRYNDISCDHLTAHRGGLELWLGNGPFFCEIEGGYFGLFWRHYVWWAAARKLRRDANRKAVPVLS